LISPAEGRAFGSSEPSFIANASLAIVYHLSFCVIIKKGGAKENPSEISVQSEKG